MLDAPSQPPAAQQPAAAADRDRSASISASLRPTAAPTRARSSKRCWPQTVERLVAASERPDLQVSSHHPEFAAINAFALPTGQLYVTRGLIALANDNAELASVLAHEMAHVIARHAAIREDQARQAALVSRVATDLLADPQLGALALAKSKIALASFSRAQEFEADGIGVGISARAGFDPYGAQRFLTSMGRNAQFRAPHRQHRSARARFSLVASGDARARRRRAGQCAAVRGAGRRRARQGGISRGDRRAASTARIRAKASCAAAASCIRSSASPSRRRKALRSTTPRRRCSA